MKKRIYLQIAQGQFFQWSSEASNRHFEKHVVEDDNGVKTAKGYRRYFDSLEGTLVKVWEDTEGKFGAVTSFAFETEQGVFVLSINTTYATGQVNEYLRSLLLSTKAMKVGQTYKLSPYHIGTNRDGTELKRAKVGIVVYDSEGNKITNEEKYQVQYIDKDGVCENEDTYEIPAVIFSKGRGGKYEIEHKDHTNAILGILDELILETEEYTLPSSGAYNSKSANSAFDEDEDDTEPGTGAKALGIEEEPIDNKPRTRTINKLSKTKTEAEETKVEEVEDKEDSPSEVVRSPRRTRTASKAKEVEKEPEPKAKESVRAPRGTSVSGPRKVETNGGLPF